MLSARSSSPSNEANDPRGEADAEHPELVGVPEDLLGRVEPAIELGDVELLAGQERARQLGRTEDHLVVHGIAPSLELLDEPDRFVVLAGCERHCGTGEQQSRVRVVVELVGLVEGCLDQGPHLAESSELPQQHEPASGQRCRALRLVDRQCVRPCGAEVVPLGRHPRHPLQVIDASERRFGLGGQLLVVREMTGAQLGHLTAFLQAVVRECPNHLEHPEPGRGAVGGHRRHERVLHETRERVQDVEAVATHPFDGVEGETAGEHREPREEPTLVGGQEPVAPFDGRRQCSLTRRKVRGLGDQ